MKSNPQTSNDFNKIFIFTQVTFKSGDNVHKQKESLYVVCGFLHTQKNKKEKENLKSPQQQKPKHKNSK